MPIQIATMNRFRNICYSYHNLETHHVSLLEWKRPLREYHLYTDPQRGRYVENDRISENNPPWKHYCVNFFSSIETATVIICSRRLTCGRHVSERFVGCGTKGENEWMRRQHWSPELGLPFSGMRWNPSNILANADLFSHCNTSNLVSAADIDLWFV